MTQSNSTDLILLVLFWLGYFTVHSALASLSVKRWGATHYPGQMPFYRLSFNILALLTLVPILWLIYKHRSPPLWAWQGAGAWLSNALALAALLGFMASLKHYDAQAFIGMQQWKARTQRLEDMESFQLSPFHRFVRHPWYFFSLVLIWTRDMNAALLVSGVMMTAYFVIGSKLEERKLVGAYGDAYRRYMQRVPGLIPLPWKTITAKEAAELVAAAARTAV
jgi:protein-S-isoprenylcysteine O-methyltransferase Ste14